MTTIKQIFLGIFMSLLSTSFFAADDQIGGAAYNDSSLIFIISGPSGVGKNTVAEALVRTAPNKNLQKSVTATTRSKREGEVDGQDYYFLSKEEFSDKVSQNLFYEYATVHGSAFYGTLKADVDARLSSGKDVVLIIDVQGAISFMKAANDNRNLRQRTVFIFIGPKTIDDIKERLQFRNKNNESEIAKRLETAQNEIQFSKRFDYYIESDTRIKDLDAMLSIYKAEKLRIRK